MIREMTLPVHISRRTPDPVFPKAERHIFMVRVEDLPPEMPKGSNPREQNIDRMVWKEIGRHLLNHAGIPNTFHLKNKGITVVASQVIRLDDDQFRWVFASEDEGIVDGGALESHSLDRLYDRVHRADRRSNHEHGDHHGAGGDPGEIIHCILLAARLVSFCMNSTRHARRGFQ